MADNPVLSINLEHHNNYDGSSLSNLTGFNISVVVIPNKNKKAETTAE